LVTLREGILHTILYRLYECIKIDLCPNFDTCEAVGDSEAKVIGTQSRDWNVSLSVSFA